MMWESKAWVVCERLIGWITVLALAFGVWNTLLRVEVEQAKQAKQFNETLEAIREKIGNEESWQRLSQPIKQKLQKQK